MFDINGQEFREQGGALLLCEVLEIVPEGVRVRILNSDMELLVGAKQDEVLGGLVADSELTVFVETAAHSRDDQADGVKTVFE